MCILQPLQLRGIEDMLNLSKLSNFFKFFENRVQVFNGCSDWNENSFIGCALKIWFRKGVLCNDCRTIVPKIYLISQKFEKNEKCHSLQTIQSHSIQRENLFFFFQWMFWLNKNNCIRFKLKNWLGGNVFCRNYSIS